MARRGKVRQDQKQLLGERILYIGSKQKYCPCGTGRKKGMMSRYEDVYYCSETCVRAHKK